MEIRRRFCSLRAVSPPPKQITVAEFATRPATRRLAQTLTCPLIERFYEFLLRALVF
jgi:hypothetical protein